MRNGRALGRWQFGVLVDHCGLGALESLVE